MTSITSSVSSAWSSASMQRAQRPGPSPERLLSKIDADGSGGVSDTELQGLLDDVAKKTGVSSQTSAADLVKQYDSDGDGSLNADELGKTMQGILPPPPSTMAFAQSRSDGSGATGQAGDDLFGKVDTDGDGAVSQTELQALLEKMSGGTASKTGVSSDELFSQLDADGDGSLSQAEFDAGRPSGEAGGGAVGGMPPPPPGGPGGAGGASASSSSTTYDPLDTNEDGVVSAAEQAAGAAKTDAITALLKTIDADGNSSISSEEARSFIDQLTSQFSSATSSTASGPEQSASTRSSDSGQKMDLMKLVQLARSQYEAAAGAWSQSNNGSLSALA